MGSMAKVISRSWTPAVLSSVRLGSGLLAERQKTILKTSIDLQYDKCRTTGRIEALELKWKEGSDPAKRPHQFWDSDIAKWIESAAYALTLEPNPELEGRIDTVVDQMEKTQMPDGYLNSFYQTLKPAQRFTNLRDDHELYCAGHLMEAAVAYFQATGKRKLLDVLCRYADLIGKTFGPGEGQINGYDGHQEVELGLMKLAAATGEKKYADLAAFFVNARGTRDEQGKHFFDREAAARGKDPADHWAKLDYSYNQAHLPVREQKTVEGHSVRALYYLAGMADVAAATKDKSLLKACRTLWDNLVSKRLYLTGGIGSTRHGERFTYDYDLPPESAYAETCAAIALVFFAQRMVNLTREGQFGDAMELALYNAVLPGISLDGKKYFYANYLATDPKWNEFEKGYPAYREEWFGCACCPPNLTRLLASIGSYAYSVAGAEVAVHLYTDSTLKVEVANLPPVQIRQVTEYPWDESITFTVDTSAPVELNLHLRIPAWANKHTLTVNGKKITTKPVNGYVTVSRRFSDGDKVMLTLPMPPRRVYAHPSARHYVGKVALARGPLIYCLEQPDNKANVFQITLPKKAKISAKKGSQLGGVLTLSAPAATITEASDELYSSTPSQTKPTTLTAIPYYTWANRKTSPMTVWINESGR